MTIREDAAELVRVDLAKANGSAYFGQTGMIDAGGRVGDGQDGQIQFDRLEFESPEDLMRHLYYTCMRSNTSEPPWTTDGSTVFCPRRFDGWSCWEPTLAGTVAENWCPKFVLGFDPRRLAYRTCHENGSWFVHPHSGREWSNYTNCIDTEDMQLRRLVNDIYIGGYTVSFLTLIISLCIFHSFRTLKCTRIRIHIHLFTSLALSCLFWIVWYKFVVEDPDVLNANTGWCVGLHILLHYLMLVNYFWMFCEGLHLHLVLVILLDERKPCHVAADDSGVLFASGLTGVSYQRRPGVADEAKLHLAPSSTARTAESDACHLDSHSPVWSAAHPAAVSAGEGLLAGTVLSDRGRPADQPARFVRFVPVLLRKPRRHLCGTVLPEPIFPRPRDAPVSREQRWAAGHAKPRRGRMTTERASLHTDEYKPARSDSPRAGPVCRLSRVSVAVVSCCCRWKRKTPAPEDPLAAVNEIAVGVLRDGEILGVQVT
ncbi:uncharacterized protein LOC1281991 isoform X2 [Anopheles gambiae]|uniref:uncharacterized protein LOC1281991 isoform X2 n=1 Tax=Anopheles gambiae TaxID=7165 RepID=UPI002AC9DBEA|nr:uncharacterized protein LOC1281991 isoform X2 [Anopheles gambiae]